MAFNFSINFGTSAKQQLAGEADKPKKGRTLNHVPRSVFRTRQDVAKWNEALAMALSAEEPRSYALQLLYNEILTDSLLSSQIENRHQQLFSSAFRLLKPDGNEDEEQTILLRDHLGYRAQTAAMLNSVPFGVSVVENSLIKNGMGQLVPVVSDIPRTNIVPQTGLFYPDYSDPLKIINYRNLPEFGTWILEYNSGHLGLLNKAVPHVLFKRFAQSCWSELCEIFGIPPRVIKTNTQDANMLSRAEQMMKDTGAAPWFIIDDAESFEWGNSVNTNGEVFERLIALCNSEMSLLISGAVIGQDTKNGNRSKDESAQEMLWLLVQSDMAMVSEYWNKITLPAYKSLGLLKGDLRFEFAPSEDIDQLWKFTQGLLTSGKNVDDNWLKEKFGVEVTGDKGPPAGKGPDDKKGLKLSGFFA